MESGRSSPVLKTILVASSLPALLAASWLYYSAAFDGPPMCYFKLCFGVPCPGCGLTRAFCCLAHLEIWRAMQFNFLAPVLLAWLAAWWGLSVARLRRPVEDPRWFRVLGRWVMLSFMVFYAGRMVVYFSAPEGYQSFVLQNALGRIVRLDLSNTYEPGAGR